MIDLERFYSTLADWQARPWSWRRANCCQFAADCLLAWGVEFQIPDCRRPADARAWLAANGAPTLLAYLEQLFGPGRPPLTAGRGWIVYAGGDDLRELSVGVVDREAIFVGENGLVREPLSNCRAAFNPGGLHG